MIFDSVVQPDDRVLLLSIPEIDVVESISARLDRGGMVCLGQREEVYSARRNTRHLKNVLFHAGPPEEIPFDDGYFTLVMDLKCAWADPAQVGREVARALAGGGRAMLAIEREEPMARAGLRAGEAKGSLKAFHKAEDQARPAPAKTLPILG